MERQKRIAAIHDISGFGKCALTVALPVISAAGIEVSAIPTAVLSTHTGGLKGYTCLDLTDEMPKIAHHWKTLGLTFDAVYSGYLGSERQIDIVSDFIDTFCQNGSFAIVDPAMADNGKMYALLDMKFAKAMKRLCQKADIIVPNMTEAAFLLDREYFHGPYTKEYIESTVRELSRLGPKKIVLTGVCFEENTIGAASYDAESDTVTYYFRERVEGMFHGTGDVFASALTAALLRGKTLEKASEIAVDFTVDSIRRTAEGGTDHRYGVDFERGLGDLIKTLDE
ncbi:MAG: pyridoxamine kinase [Clostridia bacterium]|nr:pyridoxamine kinase [Clostridia bacterium]